MTCVKTAATPTAITNTIPVFKELRPHLTDADSFLEQVQAQTKEGYTIAYIEENGTPVAAMGYRIMSTLAWGRFVYVDDLSTLPAHRGKGLGTALLQHAKNVAKDNACEAVHLDTGYQRQAAHKLYLNQGFTFNCHHLMFTVE